MDKTFSFRGITGFYTDEGSGNALVFIHGFGEDGSVWDGFRKYFSAKQRVIVPDLPGSRNSSLPEETLTIEWMADFVKAILDAEGIKNPVIIGHSMGGYVTLALTEKFPGFPDKIGLFHSHAFADDDAKKKSRQKSIDFVNKNGTKEFISELYNNLFAQRFLDENKTTVDRLKKHAQIYPAATITAGLKAMILRADRTQVLKSFPRPVLFILGKEDKAIPYAQSLEQCAYPAIAQTHLLENTGHLGMYEAPSETLEIVESFVNLKV